MFEALLSAEGTLMIAIVAALLLALFTAVAWRRQTKKEVDKWKTILAEVRPHLEAARRASVYCRGRTRKDCLAVPEHIRAVNEIAAKSRRPLTEFGTSTEQLAMLAAMAREFLVNNSDPEKPKLRRSKANPDEPGTPGLPLNQALATPSVMRVVSKIIELGPAPEFPSSPPETPARPPKNGFGVLEDVVVGETADGDPIKELQLVENRRLSDWVDERFNDIVQPDKTKT